MSFCQATEKTKLRGANILTLVDDEGVKWVRSGACLLAVNHRHCFLALIG